MTAVPEAFKSFIAAKIFVCGIIRDSKWRAARCLKKTYNKETKNRNLISRVSKWRAARCLKKSIIREKQRIISLARKPFLTQLTFKDFFWICFFEFFSEFFFLGEKKIWYLARKPFHTRLTIEEFDRLLDAILTYVYYIHICACVCVCVLTCLILVVNLFSVPILLHFGIFQ